MFNIEGVEGNEGLLSRIMTTIHGPLLAGDVLVNALGYNSSQALRQAAFRKMAPVTLFAIPERKFKYALSAEVGEWLVQQRVDNCERDLHFDEEAILTKSPLLKLFALDHGYLLHESKLLKLLGLTERDQLVTMYEARDLPFGLFRIDNRQTKLFALSLEAFTHFV